MLSVSCIIPTMNRPQLLKQTLESLFATTQGIDVEAVVVIDENIESVQVCVDLLKEGRNILVNYSPSRRGAIPCWNIGLRMARADIFFHQGDDLWYNDGWLRLALDAHRDKLQNYGLVGVNDSMHDGNHISTHALWDRQFCKDHLGGVMAMPHYGYYNVDVEFNERAKRAGKFYWCKEAVVKHIHPANSGRVKDETDTSHESCWEHDQALLAERRALDFPNDFDAVI